MTSTVDGQKSLARHADFVKLWIGQSLSLLGAEVTVVALPVIAVVLLDATPAQVGLLGMLARLPLLLFLFVGVWVDRLRRRPLLISTDVGRAALFAALPLLWAADVLTLHWLYLIVSLGTLMFVVFTVAHQAYLPSLVGRPQLVEANSKLQMSESVARLMGPSLGGLLVSAASAVFVVLSGAVGLVASAIAVLLIRATERPPPESGPRQSMLPAIARGVGFVWRHPVLRPGALQLAVFFSFATAVEVLLFLYLVRDLHLPAGWYGVILAIGGAGALIGASVAPRLVRRFGVGPALTWSVLLRGLVLLPVPLATGGRWGAAAMVGVAQFAYGACVQVSIAGQAAIRQAATPDDMQGRTVATFRTLSLALAPFAALGAGLLAEAVGLRAAIAVAVGGTSLAVVPLLLSSVPRMRELPTPPDSPVRGGQS